MDRLIRNKWYAVIIAAVLFIMAFVGFFASSVYAATWSTLPDGTQPPTGLKLHTGIDNMSVSYSNSYDTKTKTIDDTKYLCVKHEDTDQAKSWTSPMTVTFTNAGSIAGRKINVKIAVTSLSVKASTKQIMAVPYDGMMPVLAVHESSVTVSTSSKNEEVGYYDIHKTVRTKITISYADTGDTVNLPFCQGIKDVDAGGNTDYFKEAVEMVSGYDNTFWKWKENNNTISGDKIQTKAGTDDVDGDDSWYKTGCLCPTTGGTFTCEWTEGNSGTTVILYSQYSDLQNPKKSVDKDTVKADDTVKWTVSQKIGTFYEDTFTEYSSFVLKDTIPNGLTYVSAKVTNGNGTDVTSSWGSLKYDSGSRLLTWTATGTELEKKSFYNGQTLKMVITTTALNPSEVKKVIPNTGHSVIDKLTYDTNMPKVTVLRPALAITKNADKSLYQVGDTVNYTVTVKQTTEGISGENVVVTDTVPTGLVLTDTPTVSGLSGNASVSGNKWTVTFATMPYNQTATIKFKAVAKMAANKKTLKNTVSASVKNGTTVTADADVRVIHPELTVEKKADKKKYNVKDTVTYTVKVNQTTPEAVAKNVIIRDALQVEGISITDVTVRNHSGADITASSSLTKTDISYSVTIPTMNYNEPVTITYHAYIHDKANKLLGHDAQNIVRVTATNFYDENDQPKTVQDDETIHVIKPGVKVTKVADQDFYNVGDDVIYTITVKETVEDGRANDVVIRDTIPKGLTVKQENITVKGPKEDKVTKAELKDDLLTVTIDSLSWDETVTITVKGTATSNDLTGKTIENTAIASWSNNGGDPDEHDKAESPVLKPALEIVKEADKDFYNVKDTIKYTITVTQTVSGARANDVIVRDTVPDGLTLDPDSFHVDGVTEDNPATVAVDGNDFTVTLARLTYEETLVITFDAEVTNPALAGKTVVNAATAEWTNNGGEPPVEAMVESPVLKPAVEATKSADREFYNVGDTITYTVAVKQTKENARANDVVITDTIPEGLTLDRESIKASGMKEGNEPIIEGEDNTIIVRFASVEYGEDIFITFCAKVTDPSLAGETVTNAAIVEWSNHGGEPKLKPRVDSPILKPVIDLQKVADKKQYNVGDVITWTITATQTVENGRANDVVIKDHIPDGLTPVPDTLTLEGIGEDTLYEAKIDGNDLLVTLSALNYGDQAVITVQAEISDPKLAGKEIVNTAIATWSNNGGEPAVESTAKSPVLMPILDVNKLIVNEQDNYFVGDTINYQITVSQTEADAVAKDVVITDVAEDKVTLDMGTIKIDGPDGCELETGDNTFTVHVPELAYGDLVTITCSATAEVAGWEAENVVKAVCAQDPKGMEASVSALIVALDAAQTGDNLWVYLVSMFFLILLIVAVAVRMKTSK